MEEGYVYFKFEPFVLHVMCATLSDAKLLVVRGGVLIGEVSDVLSSLSQLQVAVSSGFRNSGMSCGKKERWMVAG